ncbi:Nin one binding Zn-ribbon like-domain-containing protein [Chaetomium tenue]|uniref:Nin one binding Zn-ribbon like-domain-containing protein n=1 Tax=Chaetomium tenue TaxID=1854479 RepID=A0ACB7PKZ5_9PEZI|nr:Nin one binding Zn-ribbon like-domain-containing protein [Chaetomium globosum]
MEETASEPVAQAQNEVQNPAPTTIETATSAPTSSSPSTTTPTTAPSKPIHSLVIDANAIINNDPTVSTLLAQADELYTIPAVVSEIRDAATRSRFETTLSPFLKLRNPRPESIQFVTNFARRTGDLEVLSKPDIHLLALTYDLEIERNGGDWRLRREPNQKGVNGKPPGKADDEAGDAVPAITGASTDAESSTETPEVTNGADDAAPDVAEDPTPSDEPTTEVVTEQLQDLGLNPTKSEDATTEDVEESSEDDGDGEWITPSNIKKYQARENAHTAPQTVQRVLQAALITGDMAMRNVALRINLNLLDTGLARITYLKTWVLRCHGCFKICRDMSKQFCPSCGQPTLTRVSCSTDSGGNFTLHLKKNFQYNNRGNVFSIPKPTHGSASGKSNAKGGGKNGWGKELIFAEDQKEYTKKLDEERRLKTRDIMDQDYLPSILGGSRTSGGGRIKVGAGRNVNAKKRK